DATFTHNQAELASSGGYLRLSNASPVQLVRTNSGTSCTTIPDDRTRATTLATSTPLTPSAGRWVQSKATATFQQMSWHKINYSGAPFLFTLLDFSATVDCKSTPSGGAYATRSWTASFLYRWDPVNTLTGWRSQSVPSALTGMQANMNGSGNDTITGRHDGVNITTVTTPNAMEYLKDINPLVYDGDSICCTATSDIYMFTERDADGNLTKKGYLNNAFEDKEPTAAVSGDGRTTSASINAAIRFDTNQQHASWPDSSYRVSIGKMSCEAVDNR
ncbi:MAG: hypothetical protein M3273_04555, partial [Actinomycetota bacterium]|nr:hypothetical protein [Actinomycetota bacterium]